MNILAMNIAEEDKKVKDIDNGMLFMVEQKMFMKSFASEAVRMALPFGYTLATEVATGEVNVIKDDTIVMIIEYLELHNDKEE